MKAHFLGWNKSKLDLKLPAPENVLKLFRNLMHHENWFLPLIAMGSRQSGVFKSSWNNQIIRQNRIR